MAVILCIAFGEPWVGHSRRIGYYRKTRVPFGYEWACCLLTFPNLMRVEYRETCLWNDVFYSYWPEARTLLILTCLLSLVADANFRSPPPCFLWLSLLLSKALTEKLDVYSLAMVFYAMLANKPPFMDLPDAHSRIRAGLPPDTDSSWHPGFVEVGLAFINSSLHESYT